MLDLKFIRENADAVKETIKNKRMTADVDALLLADDRRLAVLQSLEEARRERNAIAEAMKTASAEDRPSLIERGKTIKGTIAELESSYAELESQMRAEWLRIPNMTHPDSPIGASDADNVEIARFGNVEQLSFTPRTHVELGAIHDGIDFERATKVTGSKFYFLKGQFAMLEQALISWVMKEVVGEGYIPMTTPDLAKDDVLVGTGFQPRGPETQIYSIENSDVSLVGTAEITLGGYHKDEIIPEEQLPLKYLGLSHCFRTEAGTYGRESYGLYRVHQFSKLEMFIFCAPEQSDALHEELRHIEEHIFNGLGIPFRVVDICTGDLGSPAYRKYDLEAWMWGRGEGRGDWGEITSTSNCTDFQARRLNTKVRRSDGTLEYVHTLNGTAISLARALIAVIENNQQEDGSIRVPEVLVPYCGFDTIGQ